MSDKHRIQRLTDAGLYLNYEGTARMVVAQIQDDIHNHKNPKRAEARVRHAMLEAEKSALRRYAHWHDATQQVGSCGTTLTQAIADATENANQSTEESEPCTPPTPSP